MPTVFPHISAGALRRTVLALLAAAALGAGCSLARADAAGRAPAVRLWTIHYTSHDGRDRLATVVLPAGYGPGHNPPLPLVISPHGRAGTGLSNAKYFADLPAVGGFAVVSPDGMGRRMKLFSYGYPGQIADLARMPRIVTHALPWLRIDRARVYALGSSMGGQETALLVARHPRILAGAAAMDSVTDLARRYGQLARLECDRRCLQRYPTGRGANLQSVMRRETGGTPESSPRAYAARSALSMARRIARSGVPFQIWWSRADRIVIDQEHQSAALFRAIRELDPCAPVSAYAGSWAHSHEMRASELLPVALHEFGLLDHGVRLPRSVRHVAAPSCGL